MTIRTQSLLCNIVYFHVILSDLSWSFPRSIRVCLVAHVS